MKRGLFWVLIFISLMIFIKITFYPSLPVDSVSNSEVISKLEKSNDKLVKIGDQDGYQWYISEFEEGKAYERMKNMMFDKGWKLKEDNESNFTFYSNRGEVTVMSRKWRGDYVIIYLPDSI